MLVEDFSNVSLSQNQEGHPALKLLSGSSHLSSSAAHGYCAIRRFVGAAATRIYLRSHIFNFESLFDSISCIFSTKKVVKFVGHIFKGGNCVFLMLTDEHLSTEGGKMLRVEFEPREWRRGLFGLLGKTARIFNKNQPPPKNGTTPYKIGTCSYDPYTKFNDEIIIDLLIHHHFL